MEKIKCENITDGEPIKHMKCTWNGVEPEPLAGKITLFFKIYDRCTSYHITWQLKTNKENKKKKKKPKLINHNADKDIIFITSL